MFTKISETYRPSEAALASELTRKYGVKPCGEYIVRKGNAKPQVFHTYAEASDYLLAHGGVLTYKAEPVEQ